MRPEAGIVARSAFFALLVTSNLSTCHAFDDRSGTFQNPDARARPRFRYWLPDSSVDGNVLARDILSAGDVGAGGVELLPFFNYGATNGGVPQGADWYKYNFGTPAYRDLLVDALRAHKEGGMFMDIAIGPNQGQGVPAHPDDEGLQWDLIPYSVAVPANGSYQGVVPGWDKERHAKLLAVVSARVTKTSEGFRTIRGWGAGRNITWPEYVLDHRSLNLVTSKVNNATGYANVSLPATSSGDYRLFTFYERLSGNENIHMGRNSVIESIFDYGSFAIDHISSRGAQTVIDLWENHILNETVLELIKAAGNYMWEDSIEVNSNITWTPAIPSRFQERFGYSILPYLPLLSWGQNTIGVQAASPGPFRCYLDTKNKGEGYINDYRSVVTDGYADYLSTLRDWATERLGIQFSTQPSYGFPLDMAATVPIPDAPECESLTFADRIDGYRQFSGPAQLVGKHVISNEVGAVGLKVFNYPSRELLWSINRAFAGGINQFIIHGQSYTGDYYGSTWPGYTAFQYKFSESYMDKQPLWHHGLRDVLDYVARVQFVLRQGQPRVDVAALNKQSSSDFALPSVTGVDPARPYPADDLQAAGWTYTYLTDTNLDLPQATVKDGVLAPNGPRWKAFVIDASQNVTVESVRRIRRLAKAGLPVIISNGTPGYYPTRSTCSKKRLLNELSDLEDSDNVYTVARGQVAAKLGDLGLSPLVQTSNASWYSIWRSDGKVDYAFIFNDGAASKGEAVFATTKKPYLLDAWTGERSEVRHYKRGKSAITIPLQFAKDDTKIFAFEGQENSCHLETAPGSVINAVGLGSSSVSIHAGDGATGKVTLSSGKKIDLPNKKIGRPVAISDWDLTVEHWEAPSNLYDVETIAVRRNTTHKLTGSNLVSWNRIPALNTTSGVGYYSASFQWPPQDGSDATGAYISFPSVTNGLAVYVNGHLVPTPNYRQPVRDISAFLHEGDNDVLAVVPTVMWDYLRTMLKDLRSAGERLGIFDFTTPVSVGANGIIGVVEIVPFHTFEAKC